jgi:hypothetical protein
MSTCKDTKLWLSHNNHISQFESKEIQQSGLGKMIKLQAYHDPSALETGLIKTSILT